MIRRYIVNDVMKVADTGIQLFMQSHQRHLFSIRSTTFYTQQISLLIYSKLSWISVSHTGMIPAVMSCIYSTTMQKVHTIVGLT
ncbi:hypothetical protein CCY16_00544 [Wolbachia endosymbiont of Wuchereria bancrofti]|nr:hypothetical protein CCY16_00544 [Wolbachia endosymbiont of Wuchereria bancrofti]